MSFSLKKGIVLGGCALMCAAALAQSAPEAAASAPGQVAAPPVVEDVTPELTHVTSADGRSGTFKSVQGEVTVVKGEEKRAATVGAGLHETERVLTGADGMTSLVLKDGTVLSIGNNSTFDLAQFKFDSTTHEGNVLVSLLRGSMRMVTGLIAKLKPEDVKVVTPTTVIGVRGTDFIVEVKP
ncbi:MAG: FecR domain-containing protein [Ottowia sp.]|nr:FecR domain-containing protein [Ottowia sp.]